jgi:hypothetical protein
VPPSSKARIERAAKLFEDFTGHDADQVTEIKHKFPDTVLTFGKCDGLMYETVRDGVTERYIHRFKKSARPTIGASHDGTQLVLIGGNFQFTDAGITDN